MRQFVQLYKNAVSIKDLKVLDSEEYRAFIVKTGKPVKLVSIRKHYMSIPYNELYFDFFNKNSLFWLIPIDLPDGGFVGFIMRSFIGKSYATYNGNYKKQVLYGLHTFRDFKPGHPIVVTEGVKDREYLAQFYPYCVACLSSAPSRESINLLRGMTNKFIFALDNDKTGISQSCNLVKKFSRLGASCATYLPRHGKDWGSYFSMPGMSTVVKLGMLELLPTLKRKL